MPYVLFTPVGGSDPIANERDVAILHICRKYKPDCVFLYLSGEMAERQRSDDRYRKCIRWLAGTDVSLKKPLLFLTAGSLFYARPLRPWYGRCVPTVVAVAAVAEPVIVNGCTAAVPVTIPADAL